MTRIIDLHDVQGNIVKGYGRYGYPKARYVFYSIKQGKTAREFLQQLVDKVTTSAPWDNTNDLIKPEATTNIAFTYQA